MASIHKMLNPRSIAIVGAAAQMQYGKRFPAAARLELSRRAVRSHNTGFWPGKSAGQ